LKSSKILSETEKYFTDKFKTHGASPAGVDWNSREAQYLRFEQLSKIVPFNTSEFSVNDLGCGYGELASFLREKFSNTEVQYAGYDLSEEMIASAQQNVQSKSPFDQFIKINSPSEMHEADYTVASGLFNKKLSFTDHDWTANILETIEQLNAKSRLGFSFNMLTKYSDVDRMKDDLFYGDPCWFFDYCKKNFSRNVALLHDYEIYDFTILVKKERG
jgi:SAM-dependent methyltransferase